MLLTAFFNGQAVVTIPGTDWVEPLVVWLAIAMPSGSGKSPLLRLLNNIVWDVRRKCGLHDTDHQWTVDEITFEKLGELMAANNGCLLGLYDELVTFMAQINVYRQKGLVNSHELATVLSLYNGSRWSRNTGSYTYVYILCLCSIVSGHATKMNSFVTNLIVLLL